MREPLSTITAPAYLATGGIAYAVYPSPESFVLVLASALLAFGTAWMHAFDGRNFEIGQRLDHAGMNATLAALATFAAGGGWIEMVVAALAGALVLEVLLDFPNHAVMGVFVWIGMVGGVNTPLLLLAVGLLGAGFAVWQVKKDWTHALWHVLTAVGLAFLYLASYASA